MRHFLLATILALFSYAMLSQNFTYENHSYGGMLYASQANTTTNTAVQEDKNDKDAPWIYRKAIAIFSSLKSSLSGAVETIKNIPGTFSTYFKNNTAKEIIKDCIVGFFQIILFIVCLLLDIFILLSLLVLAIILLPGIAVYYFTESIGYAIMGEIIGFVIIYIYQRRYVPRASKIMYYLPGKREKAVSPVPYRTYIPGQKDE